MTHTAATLAARSTTVTVPAGQLSAARWAFIKAGGTITVCAPVMVRTARGFGPGYQITATRRAA